VPPLLELFYRLDLLVEKENDFNGEPQEETTRHENTRAVLWLPQLIYNALEDQYLNMSLGETAWLK
jgi:hypothetical protein